MPAFPENESRGGEGAEDREAAGGEEWVIEGAEKGGVEEDEIWEVEEREVAVGLEAVLREKDGWGDELVLVVVEIPRHRAGEEKREDGGEENSDTRLCPETGRCDHAFAGGFFRKTERIATSAGVTPLMRAA